MTAKPLGNEDQEKRFRKQFDQAARWLARRPYGTEELSRRLLRKDPSREIARRVIERCRELGYLNDALFVEQYARQRFERARQGPHKILAELRARGIEDDLARGILDEMFHETEPVAIAREALQKRFGFEPAEDIKEKNRRRNFLARRGFDHDTIRQVVE